jgi:hypothetical protein
MRLDGGLVEQVLGLVGRKDLDPVGTLRGLVWSQNLESVRQRLLGTCAMSVKTNDDLVPAFAQVLRLRVSLTAIAKNGNRFIFSMRLDWRHAHRRLWPSKVIVLKIEPTGRSLNPAMLLSTGINVKSSVQGSCLTGSPSGLA